MSCLAFLTPRQREALRASGGAGGALSSFRSPAAGPGKVARVRALAGGDDPKIRESAALSHHAPDDVLGALATDATVGVRCSVARNERAGDEVLDLLATDPSATVRGWVAANAAAPRALLEQPLLDPLESVRVVAPWAGRWP